MTQTNRPDGVIVSQRPELSIWNERLRNFVYIGAGTTAEVYQAFDSILERDVAVKVISVAVKDQSRAIESTLRELARLQHPSIVQVLDINRSSDHLVAIFTLCSGPRLDHYLKQTHASHTTAVRTFLQVADALAYLHNQRCLYCDIKSANIVLDETTPVLVDFGHLTAFEDAAICQQTYVGTPRYMAPELMSGSPPSISTEVFALGRLLLESLVGWYRSFDEIALDDLTRPESLLPLELPCRRDWLAILHKSTAHHAHDRYVSVANMASDVASALAHRDIVARPIGRIERTMRCMQRNPVTTLLACSAVVSMSLGCLAAVYTTAALESARRSSESNTNRLRSRMTELTSARSALDTALSEVKSELNKVLSLEQSQNKNLDAARKANVELSEAVNDSVQLNQKTATALDQLKASRQEVQVASDNQGVTTSQVNLIKRAAMIQPYADSTKKAWKAMNLGDWEAAERIVRDLPEECRGVEYGILTSRLKSQLIKPKRIVLASATYKDSEYRKWLARHNPPEAVSEKDLVYLFSSRARPKPATTYGSGLRSRKIAYPSLLVMDGASDVPIIDLRQQESASIVYLLNDGSRLHCCELAGSQNDLHTYQLRLFTYCPEEYPSSRINDARAPGLLNLLKSRLIHEKDDLATENNKSVLADSSRKTVEVSGLEFDFVEVGQNQLRRNTWEREGKINVGRKEYYNGLFAHADSTIVLNVPDGWSSFSTKYGLQTKCHGSVRFAIIGDGNLLFESDEIRDQILREVCVDIRGVKFLVLEIDDAGDGRYLDDSIWVEPLLHRELQPNVSKSYPPDPPPELDPSEIPGWRYFDSLSANFTLDTKKKHIQSVTIVSPTGPLRTKDFEAILTLPSLAYLEMQLTSIADEQMAVIGKVKQLERLVLWSSHQITNEGISKLGGLTQLKFLNLGYTQTTPDCLASLHVDKLESLYFNHAAIGSSRLTELARCKSLKHVSLNDLNVGDEDLVPLEKLRTLESIDLHQTKISDRALEILQVLPNLKRLCVTKTAVSASAIEAFQKKRPQCEIAH